MKRKPLIRFHCKVWVQNHRSRSKFGGPPDMVIQRETGECEHYGDVLRPMRFGVRTGQRSGASMPIFPLKL